MLLMKKVYFQAIRSGAKTTTLRYWRRRQVRVGSVHKIRGLGLIRIEDVRRVEPNDLTDAHARADGFTSLSELMAALDAMYPPADHEGRELYLVEFTFLQQDTE